MTTEQREGLIEKMIDRPYTLSSEEIVLIFSDEELREIYEVSVNLANEFSQLPDVNIEEEWLKLKDHLPGIKSSRTAHRWWWSAAACVAVILVCGIAVLNLGSHDKNMHSSAPLLTQNVASQEEESLKTEIEAEEQPSRSAIATIKISNMQPINKDILDDEEYLRIGQARIDNEVALAMSRIYKEEYKMGLDAVADMILQQAEKCDSCGISYDKLLDINQITML